MEINDVIKNIEILRKYNSETNMIEVKTASMGFPKKCYDTISSFANKYGGMIIFGINENNGFSIDGVYDVNDLQKQIANLCRDSMEPAITPIIIPLEYEGKNIVAVYIEQIPYSRRPCYYKPRGIKNGSYIRIGDRDDLMTDYELYSIQSYNEHIFDDARPIKRATVDDLNMDELASYINKVKDSKPNFSHNSFERCLKICRITDENENNIYPTLTGIMLFGEYPQSIFPQIFVACTSVPGTELGDTGVFGERFIDNMRIEGTIEQMISGTMAFLYRNMKKSVIINSDGERHDRYEYPLDALREAVTNALVHRDYSTQTENSYISVTVYTDRIEIINPGNLYGTNRLDKLGTSTSMDVRNPNIIKILEEKSRVVENRHSGIPTMIREMKKHGLKMPEFYEERDSFKVVFRNSSDTQSDISDTQIMECDTQFEISDPQNRISDTQFEINDPQNGLSDPQTNDIYNKILLYCSNPKSAQEIRDYIGIKSKRYVATNYIKPLIDKGLLEYTNKNNINVRNQKYITVK